MHAAQPVEELFASNAVFHITPRLRAPDEILKRSPLAASARCLSPHRPQCKRDLDTSHHRSLTGECSEVVISSATTCNDGASLVRDKRSPSRPKGAFLPRLRDTNLCAEIASASHEFFAETLGTTGWLFEPQLLERCLVHRDHQFVRRNDCKNVIHVQAFAPCQTRNLVLPDFVRKGLVTQGRKGNALELVHVTLNVQLRTQTAENILTSIRQEHRHFACEPRLPDHLLDSRKN
mmetsp:Transcript_2004/g.5710  ORF Transcript_2004/g.5710 Transcript_2004/m.5710 type:complete len:234 (+) Transcript_2004:657-1358(+)